MNFFSNPLQLTGRLLVVGLALSGVACDTSAASNPEAVAQRTEQERRNREAKEIQEKLKEIQKRDGMQQSKELDERNRIFAEREAAKSSR